MASDYEKLIGVDLFWDGEPHALQRRSELMQAISEVNGEIDYAVVCIQRALCFVEIDIWQARLNTLEAELRELHDELDSLPGPAPDGSLPDFDPTVYE